MTFLREKYRGGRKKLKFYWSVNWIKTIYFNFKKFPFAIARKLPVYFYGSVKFNSINGDIIINAPIKTAMIGFGQAYEITSRSKRIAEITIEGKLVFNGHVQFGKDYFLFIYQGAYCEMGHMSSLGSSGKMMCYHEIILGDYARIGFESQLMDSNFHQMIDTKTGEQFPLRQPIKLGNYNYLGNRISVMQNTITPDYCTVASNSVINKDYTSHGQNILVGGIPAKLLKSDISRDWEKERGDLEKWLII